MDSFDLPLMNSIESSTEGDERREGVLPLETGEGTIRGKRLRIAMTAGTIAWMFGNVWFAAISGSAFTLFAKSMNASPFEFGLFTAL